MGKMDSFLFVSDYLEVSGGVDPPSKGKPALILLRKQDKMDAATTIVYTVNSVVWNTLLKRMAQLFAYNYVFPLAKTQIPNFNVKTDAFHKLMPDNVSEDLDNWETKFIYPPLEAAILRSSEVQNGIAAILNAPATAAKLGDVFRDLVSFTCAYFMNFNFNAVAVFITNQRFPAITKDAIRATLGGAGLIFAFVTKSSIDKYINYIQTGKLASLNMTALAEKTLIERYGVVYKGANSEYVEQ